MNVKKQSQKAKRVQKDLRPLKIIEKYQPEIIRFSSVEEFREYLNEHETEMNQMKTVMLNRKYQINGYRITKLKKNKDSDPEISLRKDYRSSSDENNSQSNRELIDTIKMVAQKYDELILILQEKGIID